MTKQSRPKRPTYPWIGWSLCLLRKFQKFQPLGWLGAVVLLWWGIQTQALDLPQLQPRPLPPSLVNWQAGENGDYFDQIKPTSVGYLSWSDFPVKVYVQAPNQGQTSQSPSLQRQAEDWSQSVVQAVQEWQAYLPLQVVSQPQEADIAVWRSSPAVERKPGRSDRARSAETRYEIYLSPTGGTASPRLLHRCQIFLRPSQSAKYVQAAARHELGHALGIWGHSPLQTDTMYYAQVRHPPPISARDVNTLKRIYQQPTRLGWTMPSP